MTLARSADFEETNNYCTVRELSGELPTPLDPDRLQQRRYTVYSRMETGGFALCCWLVGFCPFGHEGSCQLLSVRVSTAVTTAAYIQA